MEFNNNNKDLKRGDHLPPLPPELEWSNMKEGILAKMHSIEQAELSHTNNKGPKKRPWLFFSLLLTLALMVTAGWFFFFQNGTANQDQATVEVVPFPEAKINENGSIDPAAPTHQGGYAEAEVTGTTGSNRTSNLLPAGEETASAQGQQRPPSVQVEGAPWAATQALPEDGGSTNFSDSGRMGPPQSESETGKPGLRPLAVLLAAKLKLDIPEMRASMPVHPDLTSPSGANQASSGSQEIDSASLPPIQQTRPVNQLILEGGITFWDEGYGNSRPDRAQYEAPIPSFQLQGYYLKGLKGGYFLMAGLQYQQLESKLAYSSTIEDYQIILEDTILQVRQNLLTGDETIIRGDAVQSVQAERRIRHYNKTQLFKTSLAMGKSWRFRSFQADLYLGGALNGVVRNQGRMFFGDGIIDYSGTANPFFQNRWTVDGVLGARLHYFPYQKLGITTGFQAQRGLMNWSKQTDVRFYPLSFSLQVGLSYAL